MRRRNMVLGPIAWLAADGAVAFIRRPSYGIVVEYDVLPGASEKKGVVARSDTGMNLFSPGLICSRTAVRRCGGSNSYGGGTLPQWVRVTWREGDVRMDTRDHGWTGGVVVGDYRVEVASRIPRDVLSYAGAGKGRAIRLRFWLMDDGVLMGWDVQELCGTTWRYSLRGGDFEEPFVYNGKLVEPGWYLKPDGTKGIIDR